MCKWSKDGRVDFKGFSIGGTLPFPVPSVRREKSTAQPTARAYLLSLPFWG